MTAANQGLWKLLRSGSLFVVVNVFAGLLHYGFQVLASQELSSAEFASLNSWFANLALFFLIGGILQYASNFFPAPRNRLRWSMLAINCICVALTAAWFATPEGQTIIRAIMVLIGSSLFGWLMGQVQIRMMFRALTIANLLVALTKLALILTQFTGDAALERFSFALFACYLPALWYTSFMLWTNRQDVAAKEGRVVNWGTWTAPILLSIATAIIPQMDLVLMSHIQAPEVFQEFARASLFYKGIYFFIFIFAQWLLPFQIRDRDSGIVKASLVLAAAAVLGSVALTALAPWIVHYILHWDQTPSLKMIFGSCLNMSLLTWTFLLIQETCAQGRTRSAAIALAILGLEAALQLTLGLEALSYLALATVTQVCIIFLLTGKAATNSRIAVHIAR